jgi:DNA recombination protein RmuC
VESVHKEETEQRRSLAQEIQAITLANRNLGAEAQALATALQGRAKLRGNWGEIQLENVLKGCGLKEGVDYLLQGRGLELRFPEGGRALPDALVRLPEGWLVIDAKTRLPDFLDLVRASEAGDGAAREAAARALGAGIRVHAEELSRKDYGSIPELGHGVPTLMFVAPEAALWEAAQADPGLFEFAQDRGIYLCTASGLWASLRALHHVAQMGRRSENIEEIARTAQRIAAQVLKAREEMEGLREAIARLLERHDAVQTRLFSGRENVQRLSEKLEVLGLEAAPKARRKPRLEDEGALRGSKGPEENPETPPELGASGGVADAAPQDGL